MAKSPEDDAAAEAAAGEDAGTPEPPEEGRPPAGFFPEDGPALAALAAGEADGEGEGGAAGDAGDAGAGPEATKPEPPAPAARAGDAESPDDEPYRERWFFDNPSIGRALRYTFAEKRLARAVFVNALLLVVALAVLQELFGRGNLGLYDESISYGRLAFLALVTVEAVLISLLAPLGFVNLFEAERREECFDQVVTSGASPHQVVFGRLLATLAFVGVVLFASLPFFAAVIVLDGASAGQVLVAYAILFAYAVCLASLTAAVAVGFDDAVLPVVIALLAVAVVLLMGFSMRGSSVLAAWSPIRHVVVGLNDIAVGLRLGNFRGPEPYGTPVAVEVLGLLYYGALSLLGLGYAFVGPDLELTRGLDSFDSVSTTRRSESTRARRGMARTLLRLVQVRFFYENVSPQAQAASPLIRALATVGLFAGAHVVVLGALWPDAPPTTFASIESKVAFPYLACCMLSLGLLALAGSGARSALFAGAPLRLGPLRVGRFAALFLIFGLALLVPAALWASAAHLTGAGSAVFAPKLYSLYALVAGYAAFMFSLALVFAMLTTNPYSAMGRTLITLFALNMGPLLWITLYRGNVLDPGSVFLFDLSPWVAGFALARPDELIPFSRLVNDEPVPFDHAPSWLPFAAFHLVVGLGCLVAGLALSRRERRAHRSEEADHAS